MRIDSTAVTDTITVADDDGPTLGVSINLDVVSETGTATATVRRNTPTTAALLVTLSSSDTTEARSR